MIFASFLRVCIYIMYMQLTVYSCARAQGEDVIYGQIIQLRHLSGDVITVQKTMAKFESQCLKVTMDEHGDEGSWFRIEPAFKFRNFGQRVPHGDRCACACVCHAVLLLVGRAGCDMSLAIFRVTLHLCV
jgi:hypothetical protein